MRPEFNGVSLEATLAPSEDMEKVLGAMKNVLGDALYALTRNPGLLRMETSDQRSLDRLHDQLRDRHVRAAARKRLIAGRSGDTTSLMISKQAAAAGVVALCDSAEESPLGPLRLTVESRRLDEVIQWLTDYDVV